MLNSFPVINVFRFLRLTRWTSGLSSEAFVKGKRVDWGKEPYIWGAYSYASPNSLGQREVLAQPVVNKLYFAGEATNFQGAPATVHGAMESAAWAVEQMLEGKEV